MQSVQGGLDDRKALYVGGGRRLAPDRWSTSSSSTMRALDHYFITAFPEEAAALDAGVPPGWKRTGYAFKAWQAGSGPGNDACRFFGTPGRGPELALLHDKLRGMRNGEGQSGLDVRGVGVSRHRAACNGLRQPTYASVTRLYNNGMGGAGEPPLT